MKKIFLLMIVITIFITGCATQADVASQNLSKSADMFQVERRIVFYNGITGDYILVIEGKCSLGNNDLEGELSVTCKTGENIYKKHFLGLSDNVTYFAEQIDPVSVDVYHYKVIFKPEVIVPDIDLDTSNK
jgi:ABC-type Fe3+-hydroxamate transport system substrate-binding protein